MNRITAREAREMMIIKPENVLPRIYDAVRSVANEYRSVQVELTTNSEKAIKEDIRRILMNDGYAVEFQSQGWLRISW